jgi:GNAT superfamily N-acetyltransferase
VRRASVVKLARQRNGLSDHRSKTGIGRTDRSGSGAFFDAFRKRTEDWQDVESARQDVLASLALGRITRVLVDESGIARGWIGGSAMYRGRVWEVHLLVVSGSHRRGGIGQALVEDLERVVTL